MKASDTTDKLLADGYDAVTATEPMPNMVRVSYIKGGKRYEGSGMTWENAIYAAQQVGEYVNTTPELIDRAASDLV